jgi:WD40 repeat protein
VLWRSLRDAPAYEELLEHCLQVLDPQLNFMPTSLERCLELLLQHLRTRRVLLVLDNLETLLEGGSTPGHLRVGYEGYDHLLHRLAETTHQSCLLFTSREQVGAFVSLQYRRAPVHTLLLAALDDDACAQLLAEKSLAGSPLERQQLIQTYAGNPLALQIMAQTIVDLFAGELAPFLAQGELIFGGLRALLAEQCARLSPVAHSVLLWLALVREPIDIEQLLALLVTPLSRSQMLETLEALLHRSLIERGSQPGTFTLQSVVLEYATEQFLTTAASEIEHSNLVLLLEHSLELAIVQQDTRQNQQRLLVAPLLAQVRRLYPERDALEEHLLRLLQGLRSQAEHAQGYGPANLLALLREQRGHLRQLDLSLLAIRGAHWQGVEMQDTSLANATLHAVVFTESFDAIRTVAISPDGAWWATGSRRGTVQLRRADGTLHQTWQAHTDTARTLAFSPDGATLATGGWDGALKLWDPRRGTLLWTRWLPSKIQRLAFAPDGSMLATGGNDAIIRFWDPASGQLQYALPRQSGPVEVVAWSPDGQVLASGGHDGSIQLWRRAGELLAASVLIQAGHTTWVSGLAFAPDGRILASASIDRSVKLWDVTSGRCLQTLTGHTSLVSALAWSPDGRLLASSGGDHLIWLWETKGNTYRTVLRERRAGVYAIAFTPDSRHLLSGSDDGTLRLWDLERARCVQDLQSYAVSLYDVAWSPDGCRLASAGTDTTITIWEAESEKPPTRLCGQHQGVYSVSWSPDGKTLASCGWGNTIWLWDTTTGAQIQSLQDPDLRDTMFAISGLDWSPDGKFLAVAYTFRGVQVWEVNSGLRRWMGQTHTAATCVVWSPDGCRLASCSDDGHVCLWDAFTGRVVERLAGHCGMESRWQSAGLGLGQPGPGRSWRDLYLGGLQRPANPCPGRLSGHGHRPGMDPQWGAAAQWGQ